MESIGSSTHRNGRHILPNLLNVTAGNGPSLSRAVTLPILASNGREHNKATTYATTATTIAWARGLEYSFGR